jgi:hypothetical protein
MKVRFYIPLNKAEDILWDIQNEYLDQVDPDYIYISQPLFIQTIEIQVGYETAKYLLNLVKSKNA